jgi:hypothetical protein
LEFAPLVIGGAFDVPQPLGGMAAFIILKKILMATVRFSFYLSNMPKEKNQNTIALASAFAGDSRFGGSSPGTSGHN